MSSPIMFHNNGAFDLLKQTMNNSTLKKLYII